MKKKVLALFMSSMLILSLTACNSSADTSKETTKKKETTVSVDKDADKVDKVDDKKDSKESNKKADKADKQEDSKESSKPAPCAHSWKDQYKTVHHDAQYRSEPIYKDEIVYEDRPVYKWRDYYTCNECGHKTYDTESMMDHIFDSCGGGYSAHKEQVQTGTEKVQVGTNRVQVGTNQVLVKEAWDEQVKTGSVCTKCNAHK